MESLKKRAWIWLFWIVLFCAASYATDYYVDNNDPNCDNNGAGSSSVPWCNIVTAEGRLAAGDTVNVMTGTYSEPIIPMNNGEPSNYITYKAIGDVIINPKPDLSSLRSVTTINGIPDDGKQSRGLYLLNIRYNKIEGFKFERPGRWVRAVQSYYNIIKDNEFDGAETSYSRGIFLTDSEYNVITGNILKNPGRTGNGDSMVLENSFRNVIENNEFWDAGHATFAIRCSGENVFRDNYIHNTKNKGGEMYQLCDGSGCLTERNLLENNVFAKSGTDGDNSAESSIQYAGQKGIIRRNVFYDNFAGFNWALYPGSACPQPPYEAYHNYQNRLYHNVFYDNKHTGMTIPGSSDSAAQFYDNIIKNNIFSKNVHNKENNNIAWYNQINGFPIQMKFAGTGFIFERNAVKSEIGNEDWAIAAGGRSPIMSPPNHEVSWWNDNDNKFTDNIDADPGFENPGSYNFNLQADSPMIDAAYFLTTATNSGSGTVMQVEDAGYFYDGFGIPGETGDTIKLEGTTTTAIITNVDYNSNTLTLDRTISWSAGQGVSLDYNGYAPDIGAFESPYTAAGTFFVGQTNCDNNGPGSMSNPWCDVDVGAAKLTPGQILLVRGGIYNVGNIVVPSGTANARITIKNFQNENVILKSSWTSGSSNRDDGFILSGTSYVTIEGLEISNYYDCIPITNGADNIILKDLHVHTCRSGIDIRDSSNILVDGIDVHAVSDPSKGCGSSNDGHAGVSIRTSVHVTIQNTVSHDNYDGCGAAGDADGFAVSSGDDINIINSTARDNDEDGLDLTAKNALVMNFVATGHNAVGIKLWKRRDETNYYTLNNIISYDNEEAGIKASGAANGDYHISIYNSLFYDNGEYGFVARDGNANFNFDIEIYNSMFVHNGYYNEYDNSCCYPSIGFGANWNVVSDYNIYYDNYDGDVAWNGEGSNSILGTDPMLVSPITNDFHLLSGSPAIDKGRDVGFYSDFDGNAIAGMDDIGPYEYGSSGPGPITCTDSDGDSYNRSSPGCGTADCNDNNNTVYPGAPELCDGKDNQCPGDSGYNVIDEGCVCITGSVENCGTDVGECSYGSRTCVAGQWSQCAGGIQAETEICDSLDNDCDAATDEGCTCTLGETLQCGYSSAGICSFGSQECIDGKWGQCMNAILPLNEICNNLDDDCDGSVDEYLANCSSTLVKPACSPDWQCTDWGGCSSRGRQSRTCTDSNGCRSSIGRPELSRSCTAGEDSTTTTSTRGRGASEQSNGSRASGRTRDRPKQEINTSLIIEDTKQEEQTSPGSIIWLLLLAVAVIVFFLYKGGFRLSSAQTGTAQLTFARVMEDLGLNKYFSDPKKENKILMEKINKLKALGKSNVEIKVSLLKEGYNIDKIEPFLQGTLE